MFTDINLNKFIFTKTPQRLHPTIKLIRLDRPIGIWLLLFPGWWSLILAENGLLNMDGKGWGYMALFGLGAVLMRGAGCIINDLWDQKLDQKVERTQIRPLASGDMSRRQAYILLLALLSLSFVILLCLSTTAIILGIFSLALVATYPLMKRITWWPQAFLGLTFNWGALMGWATVKNSIGFTPIALYLGGILWTLAYDTIYAHQDIESDAAVGIKSTARLFGDKSKTYVSAFMAAAILLFVISKYAGAPSIMTPLLLVPVIAYAARLLNRWDANTPASCLAAFKAQHILGWLILLMFSL